MEWPPDLVEDIARRRAVLFLGAGVSKNAANADGERPKDWQEFLRAAARAIDDIEQSSLVRSCIDASDLLTACELAKQFLKPDRFKSLLLSEYSDKKFKPSEVHDDISLLDARFVLTTNFDKLYENRANQIQYNTVIVKTYYDADVADVLRRSQRSVIKVHGTIDSPERTVFTRGEYARARIAHGYFYKVLESLLLTNTFVFLGASMKDPDIQLILENHALEFSGSRPHYMVMSEEAAPKAVLDAMEQSMNLRALLYDPADHHRALAEGLGELKELVLSSREGLLETMDW